MAMSGGTFDQRPCSLFFNFVFYIPPCCRLGSLTTISGIYFRTIWVGGSIPKKSRGFFSFSLLFSLILGQERHKFRIILSCPRGLRVDSDVFSLASLVCIFDGQVFFLLFSFASGAEWVETRTHLFTCFSAYDGEEPSVQKAATMQTDEWHLFT